MRVFYKNFDIKVGIILLKLSEIDEAPDDSLLKCHILNVSALTFLDISWSELKKALKKKETFIYVK